MRATDLVRQVLDLLDEIEGKNDLQAPTQDDCGIDVQPEQGEPVASRFKQIFAMLNNPSNGDYANTPNEIVAPIEAVTTLAGGGLNAPKHPHDIRVKDPSAYPDQQEY